MPTNGDRSGFGASGHDAGYNGWPNYETWLVHLWLTNDPATDTVCRQLVAAERTTGEAGEALKAYVEEESPLADQASLFSDLLGAALGRVDWRAVAASFGRAGW